MDGWVVAMDMTMYWNECIKIRTIGRAAVIENESNKIQECNSAIFLYHPKMWKYYSISCCKIIRGGKKIHFVFIKSQETYSLQLDKCSRSVWKHHLSHTRLFMHHWNYSYIWIKTWWKRQWVMICFEFFMQSKFFVYKKNN